MPSHSLGRWNGERDSALDEINHAHASVGGSARGRRYATQQINHAYAVLLSSQFQGFCRDLHSECIDHVVAATPVYVQVVLREQFLYGRKLDTGNPNPGNIGADFGRFGLIFWDEVLAIHMPNRRRREYLEELNAWRNAIAHQHFDPAKLGGRTALHLATVQQWRSSLKHLATVFDTVHEVAPVRNAGRASLVCVTNSEDEMSNSATIQVGDVVRFNYGKAKVTGVVKEDRGGIGIKGRKLYLIDFSSDPEHTSQIELPAELLEQPPTWVILNLEGASPSIVHGHNVSSITDPGGGSELILNFIQAFPDDLYACQVSANREVSYRIIQKTPWSVRLQIDEPTPERVKIVCYEL